MVPVSAAKIGEVKITGPAKTVDALVRVTYHRYTLVGLSQQSHQQVKGVVVVLELVHDNCFIARLERRQRLRLILH